ncbi:E3 ubiquitin ligase BIG BROTHER-related [Olea europaea subsp. europaea]|uniref:E3 ubiquitin ligase BIG BROTHER-related n=1 Tax=Olea europaea subsp. europaea TaxID=158383 RepID=A0A8S0U019_OLEEU|nr:E3 ubiquitin ligase BIG BROTHER-related [Olea europaea subsp. europaea]
MDNTNSKVNTNNTCEQEDLTLNPRTEINDNIGNTSSNDVLVNSNDDAENKRRQRTPFTNLSQVDADLALARTLQEQERAYMMLRMHGGSDYGSWEAGSYGHDEHDNDDDDDEEDEDEDEDDDADNFDDASEEDYDGTDLEIDDNAEDAFDVHAHAEGGEDENQAVSAFSSDEAYARALQDAEEREMAARLLALAGINEMIVGEDEDEEEDHGDNSQEAWEEVDPDELSYEELLALGEVVGTESRGLTADTIASLPSVNYKSQSIQDGSSDSCIICRLDYEDGDTLTLLSCKHSYHPECINNWLRINKVCPVCSAEVVSPSENS